MEQPSLYKAEVRGHLLRLLLFLPKLLLLISSNQKSNYQRKNRRTACTKCRRTARFLRRRRLCRARSSCCSCSSRGSRRGSWYISEPGSQEFGVEKKPTLRRSIPTTIPVLLWVSKTFTNSDSLKPSILHSLQHKRRQRLRRQLLNIVSNRQKLIRARISIRDSVRKQIFRPADLVSRGAVVIIGIQVEVGDML
jgi:hypothetical protein